MDINKCMIYVIRYYDNNFMHGIIIPIVCVCYLLLFSFRLAFYSNSLASTNTYPRKTNTANSIREHVT